MEKRTVECLSCGATRLVPARPRRLLEGGECQRCGYVGWALSRELTELVRRGLRDRPPERRRLLAL